MRQAFLGFLLFSLVAHADHDAKPPSGASPNPVIRKEVAPECEPYRKKYFSVKNPIQPKPAETSHPGKFGHSGLGEHYSEGRRRQATLWGNTGRVHFPTSTKNPEAQLFLNQGLGLLHGYDHPEAERSFRQALTLDKHFGMAYVGLILSLQSGGRAKNFFEELKKKVDFKTLSERERLWVKAAAGHVEDLNPPQGAEPTKLPDHFLQALTTLVEKFPDDIEAKAFLGHEMMKHLSRAPVEAAETEDLADRYQKELREKEGIVKASEKIDSLFKEVLKVEPRHPVHHYRIHLWDRLDSSRALDSANLLGSSAPNVGHMWHMPGHTYSDLGRLKEAVWAQEASARVDNARLEASQLFPNEHGDYSHNHGWYIENLIKLGSAHRALSMAKKMIELPPGELGIPVSLEGFRRLVETLWSFQMWDEAIALSSSPYLEAHSSDMEADKQFLLGLAYAAKGDKKRLAQTMAALVCLRDLELEQADPPHELVPAPRQTNDVNKDPGKEMDAAGPSGFDVPPLPPPLSYERLAPYLNLLQARHSLLSGDKKKAEFLYLNRPAESSSLPVETADLANRVGRPNEAMQMLKDNLAKGGESAISLAHLAELQWKNRQQKEARKTFAQLARAMDAAERSDGKLPVFQRLPGRLTAGVSLGRANPLRPVDTDHPKIETMGPLYWTPLPVPSFSVVDTELNRVSKETLSGKPTLVVFSLGTECPHCNLQLQEIKRMASEFEKSGIQIVVVTNENSEKLKESKEALLTTPEGRNKKLGFTLAGDPDLKTFKAFHVYDDFENLPLHGFYLVNGKSTMLWREVSHEPRGDLEGLLKEARRLLQFAH